MIKRTGQTLLEVLVAITIIVTGIVSLISLLISSQSAARLSYEEAIATQLAREAIEAARFIRDSNWLERDDGISNSYADGLRDSTDSTDYTALYYWRPPQTDPGQAITFEFSPDNLTDSNTVIYQQNANNFYRQLPDSPTDAWTTTAYRRLVSFYPICSSAGGVTESVVTSDGQTCTSEYAGTSEIGVEVAVTISWDTAGTSHTRTASERLYNWKYAD